MRAILVHGMGRTPLSMVPLALTLRRAGIEPQLFGYVAATQSIDAIAGRLRSRLLALASAPYVGIGHSLGGILLRIAVASLPPDSRPERLILIGSPEISPRLARRFQDAVWYRLLNGDAGALLASPQRMAAIPTPPVPNTVIAGTAGPRGRWSPFHGAQNDGIVAIDELRHDSGVEWRTVAALHPFLPRNPEVRTLVAERCRAPAAMPPAGAPATTTP